jgi:glyoxylase-like metal-dependent hydrolase (beta-lactamase superfamily II)
VREIDVLFQGVPRSVCCHEVDGVLVDPGPESTFPTLLEALADERPRAIALTHIHLDHAGAAGALVERWPDLEVWVHERGARHIVDPTRLVASASRIYGDAMDRLWGRIVPVPEDNVRVLEGEGGEIGGFRWDYTPGHAVHHVSYLHPDNGVAFVGDVCGVRIGDGPVLPPTPPPDIDVEAWHRSLDLIEGWSPSALAMTHFGRFDDVQTSLDDLRTALDELAAVARDTDEAGYERAIRERVHDDPAYLTAMPPDTLYAGLARYWQMRDNGAR